MKKKNELKTGEFYKMCLNVFRVHSPQTTTFFIACILCCEKLCMPQPLRAFSHLPNPYSTKQHRTRIPSIIHICCRSRCLFRSPICHTAIEQQQKIYKYYIMEPEISEYKSIGQGWSLNAAACSANCCCLYVMLPSAN